MAIRKFICFGEAHRYKKIDIINKTGQIMLTKEDFRNPLGNFLLTNLTADCP